MSYSTVARSSWLSFLRVPLSKTTAWIIGISLAISGGIHAFIVDVHMRDWWVAGAFFIAAAVSQTLCAYAVMRSRSLRSAAVGAFVSLVLIAAWGTSRATGIPFGPNAGIREAVSVLDLLATTAETTTVVAVLIALRRTNMSSRRTTGASRLVTAGIVALIFGAGNATAAALPTHRHTQHNDGAHSHPFDAGQATMDVGIGSRVPTRSSQEKPHRPSEEGKAHGEPHAQPHRPSP